jgi:hypothetical protein
MRDIVQLTRDLIELDRLDARIQKVDEAMQALQGQWPSIYHIAPAMQPAQREQKEGEQ